MTDEINKLELAKIESNLKTRKIGRADNWSNEVWDEIDSTNTRAAVIAKNGAHEGVIVSARQQTAGRGRLGRTWVSPPDAGIYASFLLRPDPAALANMATITLASGVAFASAIDQITGIRVGLKWVNDLIVNEKKLGGILAELPNVDGHAALIIGVGINVRFAEEDLPEDLKTKIDWLERCCAAPIDVNLLVSEMAYQLEQVYEELISAGPSRILQQWRKRSVTLGQHVIGSSGNAKVEGIAYDITDSGALMVRKDNNEEIEIHAGEISIRTASGNYC